MKMFGLEKVEKTRFKDLLDAPQNSGKKKRANFSQDLISVQKDFETQVGVQSRMIFKIGITQLKDHERLKYNTLCMGKIMDHLKIVHPDTPENPFDTDTDMKDEEFEEENQEVRKKPSSVKKDVQTTLKTVNIKTEEQNSKNSPENPLSTSSDYLKNLLSKKQKTEKEMSESEKLQLVLPVPIESMSQSKLEDFIGNFLEATDLAEVKKQK